MSKKDYKKALAEHKVFVIPSKKKKGERDNSPRK